MEEDRLSTSSAAKRLAVVGAAPFAAVMYHRYRDDGDVRSSLLIFVVAAVAAAVVASAVGIRERRIRRLGKDIGFGRSDSSRAILRRMQELSPPRRPLQSSPPPNGDGDGPGLSEEAEERRALEFTIRCLKELSRRCEVERERRKAKEQKRKRRARAAVAARRESEEGERASQATKRSVGGDIVVRGEDDGDGGRTNQHEIGFEAACIALRTFPDEDAALSPAFALLALAAGDAAVRGRIRMRRTNGGGGDDGRRRDRYYSPETPIRALRDSLARAKIRDGTSEREERLSAEVQRKGCLWIGALSEGDSEAANAVSNAGGMDVALDALDWYRFHSGVCGWGLWSIFTLCYDHEGRKDQFRKKNGIEILCRAMKNVTDSVEVARHGTAILFDIMRETPSGNVGDVARSRTAALNEGLHGILIGATENFQKNVEIVMMARLILMSTGYREMMPRFTNDARVQGQLA